jgi:hypothetical protein
VSPLPRQRGGNKMTIVVRVMKNQCLVEVNILLTLRTTVRRIVYNVILKRKVGKSQLMLKKSLMGKD